MSSVAVYVVRRIINMVITLLFLIAIVFTLIHLLAPSPYALARIWVGARATPQALQAVIINGKPRPSRAGSSHYVGPRRWVY